MSHIICITKRSVDNLVGILDETIELLKEADRVNTDTQRNYEIRELLKNAKSEREIYAKAKAVMENEGSDTLCLESEISGSIESRARMYRERKKKRREER